VHASADDDHVVAGADLVRPEEDRAAKEPAHDPAAPVDGDSHADGTPASRTPKPADAVRIRWRTCSSEQEGTSRCTRSLRATTFAGTSATRPWTKPGPSSGIAESIAKVSDHRSPASVHTVQPSVASTQSEPGSSEDRRASASAIRSSPVPGPPTSRSSSGAGRSASSRPGTGGSASSASRASGVPRHVTSETRVLERTSTGDSGTNPHPLGVVEGRAHHARLDAPGTEHRRERAVYRPEPPKADRAPQRGRARARGDAPHHSPVEGERHAPERGGVAVELEPHEPALERELAHALQRDPSDEPRLVHRDRPAKAQLVRVVVGQRVLTEIRVSLLEPEHVERVEPVRDEAEVGPR